MGTTCLVGHIASDIQWQPRDSFPTIIVRSLVWLYSTGIRQRLSETSKLRTIPVKGRIVVAKPDETIID